MVNADRDKQRIDRRNRSSFRRGADARGGADDDDDNRAEAEERLHEDLEVFLQGAFFAQRIVAANRDNHSRNHQAEGQQNAGHVTAHQQCADGQAARGGNRVEEHVLARRDDDALDGGGHRDGDAVIYIVALVHHGRDEHRADGGYVRGRGTGDAAEQHADQNVHDGGAAANLTDEDVAHAHQLLGDLAVTHHLRHHDEERHGDKRKAG